MNLPGIYSDKIDMHLVLSTMGRNVQKES